LYKLAREENTIKGFNPEARADNVGKGNKKR